MTLTRSMTVQEVIDAAPVSAYQWRVLACCFLVVTLDGFDTASIGFIAPAIRQQWQLDAAHLAPLFGAGLFGLTLGALIFGPMADRFGRKNIMQFSVAFFGLMSVLSAFATDMNTLTILRFLTGLGLGGAMPNAITLTSEFVPARRRAGLVTLMFCGFTLGSALGGVVSAQWVPHIGWEGILILGGVMPLALCVVLWKALPESPRYRVLKQYQPEKVAEVLKKITGKNYDDVHFHLDEKPAEKGAVAALFSREILPTTLLLWCVFFMSLLIIYSLSSWLPTMLNSGGVDLQQAAWVTTAFQVGGTAGAILIGMMMDRFNPYWTLAGSYAMGAVFIVLISVSEGSLWAMSLAVLGTGIGISGSQVGLNALSAALYPTQCRATGVSWSNAIGRCGAIFGSLSGGLMLSWNISFSTMFVVISSPAVVATLALVALRFQHRHTRIVAPRITVLSE
ncbi:aromatic acid/H+ symport family MFS transporter [Budviciaceae bacterium CWB-B4]|uniref:Aromatic acid/H+ symport family MFS transporter n=1 Tax=Limnobaculum xujianqingii TaxID=2738837 RepID=A0A9D7AJW2_9GAMM|nr:aromatic acid/H+ symport family MFS transporter [Limnobaculum xujianqingii]MBK5074230.1 aromatic acid/H+ symport family MFS transporter [Limnobaculum xujianqingii]MBK5177539.1 aromatic acid/H+ symport family MFS transporter [Limnobaculum xujianqingii]